MRLTWAGMKATRPISVSAPNHAHRASPRVIARELGPAEGAGAAEEGEDGGGCEQVAPEDRQARGRQHAEGHERDDARRGAEGHARAQEGERQQPASGGAEEDGLAQDLPEAPRDGPRNLGRGR